MMQGWSTHTDGVSVGITVVTATREPLELSHRPGWPVFSEHYEHVHRPAMPVL